MNRSVKYLLFIALGASLGSSGAFAQTWSAGSSQSPDASSSAPQKPTAAATQPADGTKPKKVWTNDDVSNAHEPPQATLKNPKDAPKNSATGKADAQYIANTRKELEKLQSQLKDTNQQLSDLKDFLAGKPAATSSGYQLNKGYNRVPVDQQISNLEDKKKQIQAKIDDLLDEARKKGVEPGQLR